MTCYHPKIRIEMIGKTEKAADGHIYHPAIIVPAEKEGETLEKYSLFAANYKKTIIPCRTCIGCKLDYSREWANRGYLESKYSDHNYFVTLTYDDDHLPMLEKITTKDSKTYKRTEEWKGVLEPNHLKGFIHDIRQYFDRQKNHQGIKYIACGEYGTEKERPHYHIVLFNCPLETEGFYNSRLNRDHDYLWQHKTIERFWRLGISNVGLATWNTIAYVSRYVTKKLYGHNAEDERAQKGQIPEFIRVSKGIGKKFWEENKESILSTDTITIRNGSGVHQSKPPRYFNRLLKAENSEIYEAIKEKREHDNKHAKAVKNQCHTYGQLEELENQERTKTIKAGTLKRNI